MVFVGILHPKAIILLAREGQEKGLILQGELDQHTMGQLFYHPIKHQSSLLWPVTYSYPIS